MESSTGGNRRRQSTLTTNCFARDREMGENIVASKGYGYRDLVCHALESRVEESMIDQLVRLPQKSRLIGDK